MSARAGRLILGFAAALLGAFAVTPALAASSATILKLSVPPAGNANFVRVTLSLSGIRAGAHPRLHAAVSPLGNLGTVAVIGALERKTSRGTNLVYDLAVVNIAAVTPSPANPAVRGGAIELVLRPSGAHVRAHHVSIVHDVLTGAGVHLHDFHALFLATRALTGEQYLHVTHVTATRLLQAIARLAGRYGTAFDRDLLELLTGTGGGLPLYPPAPAPYTPPPLQGPFAHAPLLAGVVLDSPGSNQFGLAPPVVKLYIPWQALQPQPGTLALADYDPLVRQIEEGGSTVLLDITNAPSWASGSGDASAPPRDPSDYANFVVDALARWDPARNGAVMVEAWNEPNLAQFWYPAPDAAAYGRLLATTYDAVKAYDPNTLVIGGDTAGNDVAFDKAMLEAGGANHLDELGFDEDDACLTLSPDESYRGSNGELGGTAPTGYRELYALLHDEGMNDVPLFATEIGWSANDLGCPGESGRTGGVSEAAQASDLLEYYRCLNADGFVKGAVWFDTQNLPSQASVPDGGFGLVDANGNPKPAYGAFQQVSSQLAAGTLGPPTGSCGLQVDRSPPNVVVEVPPTYTSALTVGIAATDDQQVTKTVIFLNGRQIRLHGGNGIHGGELFNSHEAGALGYGPVSVVVKAYDAALNVGVASAVTRHVR